MINYKLIHLSEIDSTNEFILSLKNSHLFKEGLVVSTDFQQNGRGYLSNKWESEVRKNLLISILLEPKFQLISQFKINQLISLSILDHDNSKKNGKISKVDKSEKIAKENYILSITENGFGKRTSHYEYRVTNRGGKGIIGIINSSRNGNISSSFPVNEGDDVLISTNKGRVIRTAVKEIRIAGRNTQGVRIIKLSGEEKVVSADKIDDNLV